MVALMAPALGLLSLPVALFPLAITYVAVGRYARNRVTYRQTIATLSHLTEHGGYTPHRSCGAGRRPQRADRPGARCLRPRPARRGVRRAAARPGPDLAHRTDPRTAPPCSPRPATSETSPTRGPGSSGTPRGWTRWPTTSRRRRRPTGRCASSARRCRSRAGSSRWPTPSTTSPAGATTPPRSGRRTSASTSAWATSTTPRSSRRWPSRRRTRPWAGSGSAEPVAR